MTGFGRGRHVAGPVRCVVTVRSVNHQRGCKLQLRLPDPLLALGPRIEQRVREYVERGAVVLEVRLQAPETSNAYLLDRACLRRYVDEIAALQADLGREAQPVRLELLAALPGVVREIEPEPEDEAQLAPHVLPALEQALSALVASREQEGARLRTELLGMLERIEAGTAVIESELPAALAAYRERLRSRVQAVLTESGFSIEREALARELAIFADKADVAEELARIKAHIAAARAALERGGACGRRLEFIVQELQRESSTLGAKLHDPALVQRALEIKLEVGRMREQVANVE